VPLQQESRSSDQFEESESGSAPVRNGLENAREFPIILAKIRELEEMQRAAHFIAVILITPCRTFSSDQILGIDAVGWQHQFSRLRLRNRGGVCLRSVRHMCAWRPQKVCERGKAFK